MPHAFISNWWADYPDPANFLGVSEFLQLAHWRDAKYEALIEEAHGCLDQAQRMQIYAQAQRILVDAAPVIPLFYMRKHILQKPWVRAYPSTGANYFDWKEVILNSHDTAEEAGSRP